MCEKPYGCDECGSNLSVDTPMITQRAGKWFLSTVCPRMCLQTWNQTESLVTHTTPVWFLSGRLPSAIILDLINIIIYLRMNSFQMFLEIKTRFECLVTLVTSEWFLTCIQLCVILEILCLCHNHTRCKRMAFHRSAIWNVCSNRSWISSLLNSELWIIICRVRWLFCVLRYSHTLHRNGFSPACVRICRSQLHSFTPMINIIVHLKWFLSTLFLKCFSKLENKNSIWMSCYTRHIWMVSHLHTALRDSRDLVFGP